MQKNKNCAKLFLFVKKDLKLTAYGLLILVILNIPLKLTIILYAHATKPSINMEYIKLSKPFLEILNCKGIQTNNNILINRTNTFIKSKLLIWIPASDETNIVIAWEVIKIQAKRKRLLSNFIFP
jgi:hypothetical protein